MAVESFITLAPALQNFYDCTVISWSVFHCRSITPESNVDRSQPEQGLLQHSTVRVDFKPYLDILD